MAPQQWQYSLEPAKRCPATLENNGQRSEFRRAFVYETKITPNWLGKRHSCGLWGEDHGQGGEGRASRLGQNDISDNEQYL